MAAKERSPRYPSVDLGTAIEMVRHLYDREGRTAVPGEVAAKAWGYKVLSGPVRSRIGALKSYGLVTGEGSRFKVTDRALTLILMSADTSEYRLALREAATAPAIFDELSAKYAESSNDAVRHHLVVDKKFTDDGARRLIETYRATMAVAGLSNPPYDYEHGQGDEDVPPITHRVVNVGSVTAPAPSRLAVPSQKVYRWPLGRDMAAEVILSGDATLRAKHLKMLRQFIDLSIDALADDDQADDSEAPE